MPYTVVDKGNKYFNTITYTGNGSARSLTGVNFKPDFVWIKSRSSASWWHQLQDIVRGATKRLVSNETVAEATDAQTLTSFDTDGFSLGTSTSYNNNGDTYVAWNWLASNTTASNTSGSITSTVSANTTSGFSIVSWTGSGANGTVGHGLGTTPAMIITKARSAYGSDAWYVVHNKSWGNDGNGLVLNNTASIYNRVTDLAGTGITAWSSSTFTINQGSATFLNNTSIPYIGYCFAEVKGFSKAFSYTGNGSTDGVFINLGFKPAWVMVKASSTTGQWAICDNRRGTANTANGEFLFAESSEALNAAVNNWDFLSNGLKARANYAAHNTSGVTYIGFAFAENPFVSSKGIPTTAR